MTTVDKPNVINGSGDFGTQLLEQLGLKDRVIQKVMIDIDSERHVIVTLYEQSKTMGWWKTTISPDQAKTLLELCNVDRCSSLTIIVTPSEPVKIYATVLGTETLQRFDWSVFKEQ